MIFPLYSLASSNHHLILMWRLISGLPLAGTLPLEHEKEPPNKFLPLSVCSGKTSMSMRLSGSWFRRPLVITGDSSARWGLDYMSISSHCSSLKAQKIQMPMLFPKRGIGVYFGKEVYFNLKDRGSLFCGCAGLFPLCTQQKFNIL